MAWKQRRDYKAILATLCVLLSASPVMAGGIDSASGTDLPISAGGHTVLTLKGDGSNVATFAGELHSNGVLYAPQGVNASGSGTGAGSAILDPSGNAWFSGTATIGGNVGIGTTAPQAPLHIVSSTGSVPAIQLETPGIGTQDQSVINFSTKGNGVLLGSSSSANLNNLGWQIFARGNAWSGLSGDVPESFGITYWNGASWVGDNYFRILPNGNVGIGTVSPASTLDVENGSGTASLCLNGICTTSISGRSQQESSGYQELPSGLVMQWTKGSNFRGQEISQSTKVTFPINFPHNCFNVQVTAYLPNGDDTNQNGWFQVTGCDQSGVYVLLQNADVTPNKDVYPMIFAIGN